MDFERLLKMLDPRLFDDYIRERLMDKYGTSNTVSEYTEFVNKMKKPVFHRSGVFDSLVKVSALDPNHIAKRYVDGRKIPNKYHYKLFYAENFAQFLKTIEHEHCERYEHMTEPRLVIPFFDSNKECFGFQGRDLTNKSSLRYITILIDETKPKVFGLDDCDFSKRHFVLEGPIDSMFVTNSIAMAGGAMNWELCNDNSVIVYDNEPRSPHTVKKIETALSKGLSVVIFPEQIHEKDINDMVLAGYDVMTILHDNVVSSLEARLRLKIWRKV